MRDQIVYLCKIALWVLDAPNDSSKQWRCVFIPSISYGQILYPETLTYKLFKLFHFCKCSVVSTLPWWWKCHRCSCIDWKWHWAETCSSCSVSLSLPPYYQVLHGSPHAEPELPLPPFFCQFLLHHTCKHLSRPPGSASARHISIMGRL